MPGVNARIVFIRCPLIGLRSHSEKLDSCPLQYLLRKFVSRQGEPTCCSSMTTGQSHKQPNETAAVSISREGSL